MHFHTLIPVGIALLAAYLLGSLPFAIIVSRFFGLADPRHFGSKNPGATNVLRTGNKLAAFLTLLGDALKGTLAVFLARQYFLPVEDMAIGLVALAVFFGHQYPIFLKFKGGKGVATAAGILLALDWGLGLMVIGTWLITAYIFRYSSLAALMAAFLAPFYVVMSAGINGKALLVGIISLALIGKHWVNIGRLLAGQEEKIGASKSH